MHDERENFINKEEWYGDTAADDQPVCACCCGTGMVMCCGNERRPGGSGLSPVHILAVCRLDPVPGPEGLKAAGGVGADAVWQIYRHAEG